MRRSPKPASIHLQPDEAILMHSDGISSRVDWRSMPEITEVDAQFAATEIVRTPSIGLALSKMSSASLLRTQSGFAA